MRVFRTLYLHLKSCGGVVAAPAVPVPPAPPVPRQNFVRKLFGKYLLLTNTISAGLLMVAGDLAAQEIEFRANKKNRKQHVDWTRVGESEED